MTRRTAIKTLLLIKKICVNFRWIFFNINLDLHGPVMLIYDF